MNPSLFLLCRRRENVIFGARSRWDCISIYLGKSFLRRITNDLGGSLKKVCYCYENDHDL